VSEGCGQLHEGHSGTAAQLTSLYEAHATDAFRYALHLTGRREDAEDAVQFVFLRAYGMLESGTELVNPRAWLMKATKHRSLNMLRDRREAPMADAELRVGPRYDPDPTEAEALAEVRSTLWALPESQHHAFVLRHWSGLSQDEIADVLGTTAGAVESLLVRARTTLLEDREQGAAECTTVRRRLVQALVPTPAHEAHIATCRRCRTAQTRLLRASEFATAFALVPRPYVVHALASVIPGFGASATATAAAGGAAGAGAGGSAGVGGGAGVATASAATKLALASKVALVTATAVVALGAAHPVRRAVERAVLGAPSAAPAAHRSAGTASTVGAAGIQGAGTGPATGSSHASPKAHAKGKGQTTPAGGNGKAQGKAKGKGEPAAAGSNGAGKGKSASAGSNGKATGKPGSAGSSNGKSATAGSKGKAKGKTSTSAGSSGSTGSFSAPGQSGTKPHGKG
jgi:RNA polymerase sigma-70 factor (ECF subfamily)